MNCSFTESGLPSKILHVYLNGFGTLNMSYPQSDMMIIRYNFKIILDLLMSKKLENFVYLALCAFFLCCTIYTHFCLKGLQLKLFNATLIKHSQAFQHDLNSKWIVLANKTLSKSFGVEISYKDFVDWVDKKDWGKGSLTYDYISIDKFKEHDNSNFS